MNEVEFRRKIAEHIFDGSNVVVEELRIRYRIGKMGGGSEFGMPDTYFDIVSFEGGEFDLFELKMIDATDLWNGKFLGQMLWYNFLFRTEPGNELAGRFVMRNENKPHLVHGEIESVLFHLADYGVGEVAKDEDQSAKFRSLNLIVCGGQGFELAAKYNPAIWSMWVEFSEFLEAQGLDFHIFHAFEEDGLRMFRLDELDLDCLPTAGSREAAAVVLADEAEA